MKAPWLALGLLLVFVPVLVVPTASAVPQAPGGLRAHVIGADDPQFIEFRFPLAPDDPDQDVGSYQYNLTREFAGSATDFGFVSDQLFYSAGDGLITFTFQSSGPSIVANYTIHAWDGMDEGPASCTVMVDNGVEFDYDACGAMDPAYQQVFCPPRAGDSTIGYAVAEGVSATEESLKFEIRDRASTEGGAGSGKGAYVGLNLGGDTAEFRIPFRMRASQDGAYTRTLIFFSEVNVDASSTSVADGENSGGPPDGFYLPNEGAFASGIAVIFQEADNDWAVQVYKNKEGGSILLYQDNTWTNDLHTNIFHSGEVVISPFQGIVKIGFGGESAVVSLTQDGSGVPGNFYTHWITEYGGRISDFLQPTTYYKRTDDFLCLYSLSPSLGGAQNIIGLPSQGQPIENFDGEGGALGTPTFPGVSVPTMADHLGLDVRVFGWVLAAFTGLGFVVAGYQFGGVPGAGVGGILAIPVAVFLNQIPLWFVVILFLVAMSLVVLRWAR